MEYFDRDRNVIPEKTKHIEEELPIFGAFYAGSDAYYILSGQRNPSESPNVEVYRLTKYSKSWVKQNSAGLKDCYTTVPFDAGCPRMAECGDSIVIHTSHERYLTEDGKHHQSNITVRVNKNTMKVLAGDYQFGIGYASHSFNQFVKIEDGKVVLVDHGDAFPRSVVLTRFDLSQIGSDSFAKHESADLLKIPGTEGDNATGVTVGGFEISASHYLVAGSSVVQDAKNTERETYNVFVASADKKTLGVDLKWITSFAEGDGTVSTPQLVKLDGGSFLLLWERDETVYYTALDASGNPTGSTYTLEGSLSDCVPVLANGRVVWYTWYNDSTVFYEIDVSDLSSAYITTVTNGHKSEDSSCKDGVATFKCSVCGETFKVGTYTSFIAFFNREQYGTFVSVPERYFLEGEKLYMVCSGNYPQDLPAGIERNDELVISRSDDGKVAFSPKDNCFTMRSHGAVTVTVAPKYNPGIAKEFEFVILSRDMPGDIDGTCTVDNMDAVKILINEARPSYLTAKQLAVADVNGDGAVNNIDASAILRLDAGLGF